MSPPEATPTRRCRLLASVGIGLLVVAYVIAHQHFHPEWQSDVDQSWAGARALLRHQDPYAVIGPQGRAFAWPWSLYYPLSAAVLMIPFAPLPLAVFHPLFFGASSAWLAYVLSRHDFWRLAVLASGAFAGALVTGAWEIPLTAAALTPGGAFTYLAKPNIGLALGMALRRSAATYVSIGAAAVLLAACFVIQPPWVTEWHRAVASSRHFVVPVLLPGGFLVSLALLRWRRAEARLLLALACVPQTLLPPAVLPLLLVARSRLDVLLLTLLSYIPALFVFVRAAVFGRPASAFLDYARIMGPLIVISLYLPCTALVLWRPNLASALGDA